MQAKRTLAEDQAIPEFHNELQLAFESIGTNNTEGVKHDSGKPDLSMVSWELMEEVAKVRMFGAQKYARDNWKRGFKVTRSLAASLRHIFLFLAGQTNDPESGLSHLSHAVCGLEHAIFTMKHKPELDDRWKG
jgi:hypothetical protein